MIYIMRHGQTGMNKIKALQGRSDLPLTEIGVEQAEAAGAWFRGQGVSFSKVYSSPLNRAIHTAKLAAGEEVEVITDDRLIEMDYGPYEGTDLKNPPPEIITFFSDFVHNPAPEGMEQLSEVVKRAGDFMEELRRERLGGDILISTHAILMKGILEYLTPESGGSYWSKYIANCSVYATEFTEDGYTVPVEV